MILPLCLPLASQLPAQRDYVISYYPAPWHEDVRNCRACQTQRVRDVLAEVTRTGSSVPGQNSGSCFENLFFGFPWPQAHENSSCVWSVCHDETEALSSFAWGSDTRCFSGLEATAHWPHRRAGTGMHGPRPHTVVMLLCRHRVAVPGSRDDRSREEEISIFFLNVSRHCIYIFMQQTWRVYTMTHKIQWSSQEALVELALAFAASVRRSASNAGSTKHPCAPISD